MVSASAGIVEHEAGDLTCTVEASMPLEELNATLARSGQMLALDPPGSPTVGDVFDRGLFGPRAHRYGLPRDLVLGMRARLRDGTIIRGGGKVVKNVAGYDLPKLFTGAGGLLGQLLELTLRLHPLPTATCTVVVERLDAPVLERLAPACVEVCWPPDRWLVRFESAAAAALARRAQDMVGGELVPDDEAMWAAHRARQAGLHLHRCAPSEAGRAVVRLRDQGATAVVGRGARGWLFADVPAPTPELTRLERAVVERFGA